ncbi:14097_t:CDS:2, partial [Cetraspora pellucida]
PLSDISNSSCRKKIKRAAKNLFNDFETEKNKIWHSLDNPKLKEIVLKAGEQLWLVKFEEDQQLEKKRHKNKKKHNVDEIIQKHIPLLVFDMKPQTSNSNLNSKNSDLDSENSDSDSKNSNSDSEDSDLD